MTSLRTLQFLGLLALGVGFAASVMSRRAPMRGWAAVVLLMVSALSWAFIESGETSRPSNLPMFLIFLFLAPVAVMYSFYARRAAPDRLAARAAFAGPFVIAAFLLFMVAGIIYSLVAL